MTLHYVCGFINYFNTGSSCGMPKDLEEIYSNVFNPEVRRSIQISKRKKIKLVGINIHSRILKKYLKEKKLSHSLSLALSPYIYV